MQPADRKAAIAVYKERKRHAGIFAVHCQARGETWVGGAPDISTIRNRIWFALKHGGNGNAALKAAYAAEGEAGLRFEILEAFEADADPYIAGKILIGRARHWCEALAARAI
jgi:hypothetical protein